MIILKNTFLLMLFTCLVGALNAQPCATAFQDSGHLTKLESTCNDVWGKKVDAILVKHLGEPNFKNGYKLKTEKIIIKIKRGKAFYYIKIKASHKKKALYPPLEKAIEEIKEIKM